MTDNDKFEVTASAFHAMTGMLAPGKDSRETFPRYEDRCAMYQQWIDDNGNVVRAMLKAMDDVL